MQPPVTPPTPPVGPDGGKTPPKKIIKKIARQQMFPAKTLTSDEEIDKYIENVRKQMNSI